MTTQIMHYHLFKNAGTSLDEIFKKNFGDKWVTEEFHGIGPRAVSQAVSQWIDENSEATVFSSHTARGPLLPVEGRKLLSIMFVRHPIDRLKSAYEFEARQESDSFGSVLAKQTSFAGYVRVRGALPNERFVRNFHGYNLGLFIDDERPEAVRALEATEALDVLGVVDRFDDSLRVLSSLLGTDFPEFQTFKAHANRGAQAQASLTERLDKIREELGADLWDEVLSWNVSDFEIYERANSLLDKRISDLGASSGSSNELS